MSMTTSYAESAQRTYERIENSKLNAFITLNKQQALQTAKDVDDGKVTGRLAGMTVAVKDCITTKGLQTTCGSKILTGYVPPFDAEVVARLRKEGAVITGKANMDGSLWARPPSQATRPDQESVGPHQGARRLVWRQRGSRSRP
jgi:aspartyl-tRNA(Asn)/glutamyl-tRNA(Gln) amidotransferase subunit A